MDDKLKMVEIVVLGESFQVPTGSTIINALEFAGFQLTHGVGCREGFCGACSTIYREKGDYKLQAGLACQTVVTDGMHLAQIPFVPAEKPVYDLTKLTPDIAPIKEYYPVVFRCVACNTCTKACPQDLKVMDYVQALIRGDIERAADLSFDCIRCGLCALRCPSEIVQYNAGMLARRLCGRYLLPESKDLTRRVKDIAEGKYDQGFDELKEMDSEKLKEKYYSREIKLFDI